MLAHDLLEAMELSGIRAAGLDLPEVDITKPAELRAEIESIAPALVINCAAYTAVDRAEAEQDLAYAVNRDGPANIAEACARMETPLIHISTDYVFDGESDRPYKEADPANPLSVYGRSKYEGEEVIRARLPHHLIFRTAWLYGVHGNNFVKTILKLARSKEELRIVADQRGSPTWTRDFADALVQAAKSVLEHRDKVQWGTYHFCSAGQTTWHEFAEEIVAEAGSREPLLVKRISPIGTQDYPLPAKRPAWSVLDCTKLQETFKIVPPYWKASLSEMMREFYAGSGKQVAGSAGKVV